MSINKQVLPSKINAFVAAKLQGKTAATAVPVYTSQDPYAGGLGQFIRNPDCWLNGIKNISCFSPAQMSGANWRQRGGTLVTRKHALFAKHFVTSVITGGTPLIFVADDSTVIRRNIIQYAYVPWTDVAIALLDSEVPSNIQIAKVLPKNYSDYLNFDSTTPVYCVALDQEEKAMVKISTGGSGYIVSYEGQNITYSMFGVNEGWAGHQYQSFNESIVVGDSGNPVFIILENELVVTTTWWTSTQGPFISSAPVYDATNAAIESLSPGEGYALTDANLSSAYESMSKLYFNPTVSDNYGDLANWYHDSQFTLSSVSLPSPSDNPVMPWGRSIQRVAGGSAMCMP